MNRNSFTCNWNQTNVGTMDKKGIQVVETMQKKKIGGIVCTRDGMGGNIATIKPLPTFAERLPATMTRYTHTMANALPSRGFHPETAFLTQQNHLPPQNEMLVPHCGQRSGTPSVNDQLSGVTEGSSQMNTWPAAQMSPGPLGGV